MKFKNKVNLNLPNQVSKTSLHFFKKLYICFNEFLFCSKYYRICCNLLRKTLIMMHTKQYWLSQEICLKVRRDNIIIKSDFKVVSSTNNNTKCDTASVVDFFFI